MIKIGLLYKTLTLHFISPIAHIIGKRHNVENAKELSSPVFLMTSSVLVPCLSLCHQCQQQAHYGDCLLHGAGLDTQ